MRRITNLYINEDKYMTMKNMENLGDSKISPNALEQKQKVIM